ncbi:hypothetical protein AgCh_029312 [Apium graveolens]
MIIPGGGAAPSTASWTLSRCRGVVVVGFLQNNTGRGLESRGASGVRLSPSRAGANVSRAGVYQGSACGTELVRSGAVRDSSSKEPRAGSGYARSREKTQLVIHGVEDQPLNRTGVVGLRFMPSLM